MQQHLVQGGPHPEKSLTPLHARLSGNAKPRPLILSLLLSASVRVCAVGSRGWALCGDVRAWSWGCCWGAVCAAVLYLWRRGDFLAAVCGCVGAWFCGEIIFERESGRVGGSAPACVRLSQRFLID